jgi:20S proteasome subunit beta 3
MYTIKEEREITPITFAHLVSSTLYERRFGPYFIEPVVAGLEPVPSPDGASADTPRRFKPFIMSTDLIGCINWAKVRVPVDNGRRAR